MLSDTNQPDLFYVLYEGPALDGEPYNAFLPFTALHATLSRPLSFCYQYNASITLLGPINHTLKVLRMVHNAAPCIVTSVSAGKCMGPTMTELARNASRPSSAPAQRRFLARELSALARGLPILAPSLKKGCTAGSALDNALLTPAPTPLLPYTPLSHL